MAADVVMGPVVQAGVIIGDVYVNDRVGGRRAPQVLNVASWDPVVLGVHKAIGGGLPPYVPRAHDDVLRAVLDPECPRNRLVVLRGASSTGKSRAAHHAVVKVLPEWGLVYPRSAAVLADLLAAGLPPRTVLWLNELRHYADDVAAPLAMSRLADLLTEDGPVVAVTSVWPEFWSAYTAHQHTRPGDQDTARYTRSLLAPLPELSAVPPIQWDPAKGGVVDVADAFTPAEIHAATRSDDLALAVAVAAAGEETGQVAQYLAGVPDMLDHYQGPGADHYGRAAITAALDATRLGHTQPLTAELLAEAAVGYLGPIHRASAPTAWARDALGYATRELKGTVRVLYPIPPEHGIGIAGYRPADYLDQHSRRTRQADLGPTSLWDAFVRHITNSGDLTRLARSAEARFLYRHAACLAREAVERGSARAGSLLVRIIHRLSDSVATEAAGLHVAAHADLTNPGQVAGLLHELREARAWQAVAVLLERDPSAHVAVANEMEVADLFYELHKLKKVGAQPAVATLADRAAAHAGRTVQEAGGWLHDLYRAGAERAVYAYSHEYVGGLDPDISGLLRELREAGAEGVAARLEHDPATDMVLVNGKVQTDPGKIATVVHELRQSAEARQALETLVDRAAHAELTSPYRVADLLGALRLLGSKPDAVTLSWRDPAAHAHLNRPPETVALPTERGSVFHYILHRPRRNLAVLLNRLRETGEEPEAATALADRAANAGVLPRVEHTKWSERTAGAENAARLLRYGRTPAGDVSLPWTWDEAIAP